MIVTIQVTQEDLLNGRRRDGFACPVALAIDRRVSKHPICYEVFASRTRFRLVVKNTNHSGYAGELPSAVSNFIWRFDTEISTHPFIFNLEIPDNLVARDSVEEMSRRFIESIRPHDCSTKGEAPGSLIDG